MQQYYVMSTFDVRQSGVAWTTFKNQAAMLSFRMVGENALPKWKLLGALSSITDLPNSVLHLWRIPDPNELALGKNYFEGDQSNFDAMLGACDSARTDLLEAMPYDPGTVPEGVNAKSESADGRFYFLWVELTLRPGAMSRTKFVDACKELLLAMETERTDWTLVAAGSTVSGRPNTVIHLWRLKDANALLDGMNWFGENNPPYGALMECCQQQRQHLFTSMIYNPLGINQSKSSSSDEMAHGQKLRDGLMERWNRNAAE